MTITEARRNTRILLVSNRLTELLRRVDPYLILLLALSIFAIGPLLGPGYFWGAHDGRHSVYFLFEFDRSIQDGIFYPRWAPDYTFGYGYPMFNIYAPGALYVSEALHLIGFDFVTATKIAFALAILLSGPAMFGFIKRLTGSSAAAFLSGLAYIYIPYHIADIYVRAALEESVALVFLPLALWGFYEVITRPSRLAVVGAAAAYAAMAFTHNGITVRFTIVLAIWVIVLMIAELRKRNLRMSEGAFAGIALRLGLPALGAVALGVGLAAIFFIPALVEYQYVRVDQWFGNYYDYTNHFVYFFQLFDPNWGFGISQQGPRDGMPFQLGVIPVILAFFSIIAVIRNPGNTRRHWLFFLGLLSVETILMLGGSLPIWRVVPILGFAQFPWRLEAETTVALASLAGAIILVQDEKPDTKSVSLPTLLIGALILLGSYPYLTAQMQLEAKEGPVSILGLFRFQQSAGEMTGSTAWVKEIPTWSPIADVYFAGKKVKTKIDLTAEPQPDWVGVDQTGKGIKANGERVRIDSSIDDQPITFNTFYYPGWHAYITPENSDQIIRELPITQVGELGRIQVLVPKGRYWLILRFEDTLPRVIGYWASVASIVIVIGLLGLEIRSKRQRRARRAV